MILIQNDKLRQKMKSDWVSGAKQKSFTIINMRCVQVWTREPDPELKAEEWGWKNKDDFLYPLTADHPPAPRMLLKIVKCSCRVQCSSARCGCFKNSLVCTSACRTCKGTMCSNSPKIDSNNDEENLEP
ncbi:hypothetical protein QYM36_015576 [Artemia franciscana]|uniref:Tesmin/TSO1-like CXC domain-containing protein n=1 Tax=Artemia franciscana TaxID=6661 RepID=A0AA88L4T2_ARTSF|nr:hypothetical protein QYM36_015576 [Artemia franciscana]